ncbi:MAG: hypothetical protein AB7P34_03640 [Vicinamibacterales bacterium]
MLLIGALSLSAGWLAGKSTATRQGGADAGTARQRAGARPSPSADNVAPFTGELRRRLETQPAPSPSTGRNPFAFGPRRAPGAAARDRDEMDAAPPAAEPAPVPFTPPEPILKLSGIASSQVDGVAVLTAIINDNGSLAFAKTGDRLPSGATVIKVEEGSVVLMDAAGVTQTLRLP